MIHTAKKKTNSPRTSSGARKEVYPHFRRYRREEGGKVKRAKHPKLIVERKDEKYGFVGLTSSPKRGHHNNFPLITNPQKGRRDAAYLREELRYEPTEDFSDILSDYRLTKADKARVLQYIARIKAKKNKRK